MTTTPNHTDRPHRTLGGSTAHIWVPCPGSVFYLKEIGKRVPSKDMVGGTKAHGLGEMVLHDFLEHKVHGTDPDIRAHLLGDDEDMIEAAYAYRDAAWEKGLHQSITGKAYGFEEEFTVEPLLDMGGPCDFWCIYIDDRGKRVGYLLDYKYGYRVRDAENSEQLALYAVGMRKEMRRLGKDLDYIRGAIFQPRPVGDPYRETIFTKSKLDSWEKKFLKAGGQIFIKKEPKYKVGDWCQDCRAQGICTTYQQQKESETQLILSQPDINTLPTPEQIPDAQLTKILQNKESIEDFLKSCQAYAFNRIKRGDPLPGFKIVNTQTRRKWREETEEIATTLRGYGIEPYKQPTLKNITDIEKTLVKITDKATGKERLAELTTQTLSSEILVPDDDPRDAVVSYLDLLNTTTTEENKDDKSSV